MAVTQVGCGHDAANSPDTTSQIDSSSLAEAACCAPASKAQTVANSSKWCQPSWRRPSRSQRRSTPGSSTDQSVPSPAKANASGSPSVWNGWAPKTRVTWPHGARKDGGTEVLLMRISCQKEGGGAEVIGS